MSIESAAKCVIRAVIRYLVVMEKSPHEIFNEVRTVSGHMNRTSVYKLCREFKNGRSNVYENLRSERSSILTTPDPIRPISRSNCWTHLDGMFWITPHIAPTWRLHITIYSFPWWSTWVENIFNRRGGEGGQQVHKGGGGRILRGRYHKIYLPSQNLHWKR